MTGMKDGTVRRNIRKQLQKRLPASGILLLLLLLVSACASAPISPPDQPSALSPHGPAALQISSLWWVMFGLGAAVFVLVLVLLAAALLRRRRAAPDTPPESGDANTGRNWLIRGGLILPLVILAVVFGYTITVMAQVENPQAQAAYHIKVTARRWWWEVQYPDQGFTTANEIHIPVGVPVRIDLESTDVIHSFWVPELHGKMDVIPGVTNFITIQADQPGEYRGECAEYCGQQHAEMDFLVVAQSQADFTRWVTAQQQPASTPTDPAAKKGQQVFLSAGCVFCHTIQGVSNQNIDPASQHIGPDLTHFASRLTIAGASLTNNTNNLAGWVIDAQHLKPESDMPKMTLTPQDLQSLLAFLQQLK